ncbi:MAG: Hsp20 family protein [Bryobacteraceae bacterium]
MPKLTITKIAVGHDVPLPACLRVSDLSRAIEARAYEIYLERGGGEGDPLDDWIQAEREKLGHARANLYEDDTGYRAEFQVPGFEPDEIQVAISPLSVGLHALHWATSTPKPGEEEVLHEFSEHEAYRQVAFPTPVDPNTAEGRFEDGVFRMTVSKAQAVSAREEDPLAKGAGA